MYLEETFSSNFVSEHCYVIKMFSCKDWVYVLFVFRFFFFKWPAVFNRCTKTVRIRDLEMSNRGVVNLVLLLHEVWAMLVSGLIGLLEVERTHFTYILYVDRHCSQWCICWLSCYLCHVSAGWDLVFQK